MTISPRRPLKIFYTLLFKRGIIFNLAFKSIELKVYSLRSRSFMTQVALTGREEKCTGDKFLSPIIKIKFDLHWNLDRESESSSQKILIINLHVQV